jgi:ABC-type antimicrobial peptide transport system permease subunit
MIKSFFKMAWRSLVKDRQFSLLNLAGLSIGLTCALLIFLWINTERSYDKFHKNNARLYQVMQNEPSGDGSVQTFPNTPDLLAATMKQELPEIQEAVIAVPPDADENSRGVVAVNDARIKAHEMYVTPNFFDVFSYKLLEGNPHQALSDKSYVLLSESLAMKLFHTTHNIIGRTVTWDRGLGTQGSASMNGSYTVSGVFADPPENSSQQFDLLFTHALYFAHITHDISWFSSSPPTYVLLKKGTNVAQLNKKLESFIRKRFRPGTDQYKWAGTFFLQPYQDTHLYNHYENGKVSGGRIAYVQLFSIIAIGILIIACINFMNLSTARAAKRIKVVGIKKVMGATRAALILQYLGESMLMTIASLMLAALLASMLLPSFGNIAGEHITLHLTTGAWTTIALITLLTGLLAGSYPALYLSGFRPAKVLKGGAERTGGEAFIRKCLVVSQFSLSAILIVTVLVVYGQMQLVQNKNLGYNKDNVLRMTNEGGIAHSQEAFLADVRTLPGVAYASDMEGDILSDHSSGGGVDWPGKTKGMEFDILYLDYDLMETMGLQMKEGRTFDRNHPTDKNGLIFNETAIAAMHLKNPIGQPISLYGTKGQIIGVVKDFNYESLYKRIGPLAIGFRDKNSNIFIRIRAGREKETLAHLASVYKKYNPGLPFEFSFLDKDYQALYAAETRVSDLSKYFAGIAIIISCLGLFGLSAFNAQRRQKEISIRKVVGASVKDVVVLLSKDSLVLILLAVLIAFPLSWWAMHRWLEGFAYRISLSPGLFVTAGTALIVITLLTISFQSIRAAVASPANALKQD